jgi:hypothetical protein
MTVAETVVVRAKKEVKKWKCMAVACFWSKDPKIWFTE